MEAINNLSEHDGKTAEIGPDSFDPRTWARPRKDASKTADCLPQPDRLLPIAGIPRRWLLAGVGGVLASAGLLLFLPHARKEDPEGFASGAPPPPTEQRRLSLAAGESVLAAMSALGVRKADLIEAKELMGPAAVGPGRLNLSLERARDGLILVELRFHAPDGSGLALERNGTAEVLAIQRFSAGLRFRPVVIHGEVDSTNFYSSAVTNHMNDALVPDFTRALAFDLDFAREVVAGDSFEAVYEEAVMADGAPTGDRRLLFAGLRHAARPAPPGATSDIGKTVELYAFKDAEGRPAWFDARGRAARKALMRTPLEGARVTSVFGPRKHPVDGFTRTHQGVDFGAAIGTPVYASGDGVVEFASVARGYGNYLKIRHNEHLVTAYAHLDQFGEGIAPGAPVRQGDVVARSGMTGVGTGPHLHYEIIVDARHVDPLASLSVLGATTSTTLTGALLKRFLAERDRIDVLRAGSI